MAAVDLVGSAPEPVQEANPASDARHDLRAAAHCRESAAEPVEQAERAFHGQHGSQALIALVGLAVVWPGRVARSASWALSLARSAYRAQRAQQDAAVPLYMQSSELPR
ncbi:MAG: hypothetical protein AB7O65_07780 [Candidatus Korobacteraceae bacterium]